MRQQLFTLIKCFSLLMLFFLYGCESSDYIYILSRNSQSKEGNLVLKYNLFSENISHIGIAFDNNPDSFVYHVSYDKKNHLGSSLLKEKFTDFWSSPQSEDNRIWALPISKKELKNAKKYIYNLEKETIKFDFDPKTDLGLYCSEFVYNVLKNSNSRRFQTNSVCKELKGYQKIIAGENYLCYYPADFFLVYKDIKELKNCLK